MASFWGAGFVGRHSRASVFAVLMLSVFGCVKAEPRFERKVFPLTILAVESKAWPAKGVPEEIRPFFLPIRREECPHVVFFPEVTLVRLGPPERKEIIQAHRMEGWRYRLRRLYGASFPIEQLTREAMANLSEKVLPADFTAPAGAPAPDDVAIGQYMGKEPGKKIYVMGVGNSNVSVPLPEGATLAAVGSAVVVATAIAKDLCRGQEGSRSEASSVVLYGYERTRQLVAAIRTPAVLSAKPPRCSEIYRDLAALARDPGLRDRNAVDEKLRETATLVCPNDYRFPYERARLAVYGRVEHPSGFTLLFAAAEIAIVNGDADEMLNAIEKDAVEGGGFYRLSSNHEEWPTILRALRTRDSALVRR